MPHIIPFSELSQADLIVDAIYEGGSTRNMSDDPIAKLIPGAGNQGGFRQVGTRREPRLVVIYSSLDDPDWPDFLDPYSGVFTYFGDNKQPGKDLHDTSRGGNALLQRCFGTAHLGRTEREAIPPFCVFTRGSKGRDVVFRGLAVPGMYGVTDDLVAVWRSKNGERFQNYRAKFTILDVASVTRAWLDGLTAGASDLASAPNAWRTWIEKGTYSALTAEPTVEHRTKDEQVPNSEKDRRLIGCLYDYFKDDPTQFEACAAALASKMDSNMSNLVVTRPSVDGGRDATGEYLIGPIGDRVALSFSLEAKCYELENGVGVKELSRLISRLRHREFGVLVTTSFLGRQAYEELRFDRHPVIVIAAADIVAILTDSGLTTPTALRSWLEVSFPRLSRDA